MYQTLDKSCWIENFEVFDHYNDQMTGHYYQPPPISFQNNWESYLSTTMKKKKPSKKKKKNNINQNMSNINTYNFPFR